MWNNNNNNLRKPINLYKTVEALTAGSSQPSGPKCGITMSSPALFFSGLLNLHKDPFPSEVSQAGLITVMSIRITKQTRSTSILDKQKKDVNVLFNQS